MTPLTNECYQNNIPDYEYIGDYYYAMCFYRRGCCLLNRTFIVLMVNRGTFPKVNSTCEPVTLCGEVQSTCMSNTQDSSVLDLNCMLQNPAVRVCVSCHAPFVWLSELKAFWGVREIMYRLAGIEARTSRDTAVVRTKSSAHNESTA